MQGRTKLYGLAVVAAALAGLAGLWAAVPIGTAQPAQAPENTQRPTISDTTPFAGQTLTANPGTWSGTQPITFTYQWRRCNAGGQQCADITGAITRTYAVRAGDVGNTLRVRVTATNRDGSRNATSVPTAVITAAPPPARGCDANAPLQVQNLSAPERLNVSPGTISPAIVTRSTTSITVRFQVTCKGKPVQGALLHAAAVPFNQFRTVEQPTGADGSAQLTMSRLRGFPAARQQQLLVVFARARKPGENLLGGISTRRLVSFPVDLRR